MTHKSLTRSDSAITTSVSMIMAIALIASVITIIHVSYIPEWKADAEHSHMDDVWGDMSNLKSNIDILSVALSIDSNSMIAMSVPVKMGGGNIPIVGPGKTSGRLDINDNEFGIYVEGNNGTGINEYNSGLDLLSLGSITYTSSNSYYIDQTYEYENGALIVAQGDNSLMKLSPGMSIQNNSDSINITINALEITGAERSISSNSFEEVYLDTDSSVNMTPPNSPFTRAEIIISTEYPDAWEGFFNISAYNANLRYMSDYTISSNGNNVTFEILDTGKSINLYIKKNSIRARLDVITL